MKKEKCKCTKACKCINPNIIFIKKEKDTKIEKIVPSEPLIDFEKNFIEVKK